MRGRGAAGAIAASPTMVGAVTTLIVIVAVFLAYNANAGLPFVPVYRVSIEIPDAARLTNNNEVRIGGNRVGVVETIDAIQTDEATTTAQAGEGTEGAGNTGGVVARLNLKLDKSAEGLPVDSIFRIRYRSSFGLKYLEIVRGTGKEAPEGYTFDGTDDGATCALPTDPETFASTSSEEASNGCFQTQTEFDDIANTFDLETRTASRVNLEGFGSGFAGRGTSLNDAITALEPLFTGLKPVAEVLSAPETRLRRLFPELADAARIVAPVAEEQASFFTNAGIAFAAISSDELALQESISEGPPTLETGIELLPAQQTFLREFAVLSRELRPGVSDLRATLPVLNEAIEVGTPVLRDTTATNRRLRGALTSLNRSGLTAANEGRPCSVSRRRSRPPTRWPSGSCPRRPSATTGTSSSPSSPTRLSDRDQVGYAFRQMLTEFPVSAEVQAPATGYSGIQSNGRLSNAAGGTFEPYEIPILNAHPYGPAGQQNADCQGGQSGYELGDLRVPGQVASNPANGVSDLPGSRGPTTLFYNDAGQRELRTRGSPRARQRHGSRWANEARMRDVACPAGSSA